MAKKSASDKQSDITEADFFPQQGERALSIGQTGSGKTEFNIFVLSNLPNSPVVIYDTKIEPKFEKLKNHRVVHELSEADDAVQDETIDYIIYRPHASLVADPDALDNLLGFHYENWHGVDAYIDEAYHFHRGGYAGPGLVGLYTRGRSRGITTLASTQQPAWLSGFMFSETQLFYIFNLIRKTDIKKVGNFVPKFSEIAPEDDSWPKHHFYFKRMGGAPVRLMKPIALVGKDDSGYTDVDKLASTEDGTGEEMPKKHSRHAWF